MRRGGEDTLGGRVRGSVAALLAGPQAGWRWSLHVLKPCILLGSGREVAVVGEEDGAASMCLLESQTPTPFQDISNTREHPF